MVRARKTTRRWIVIHSATAAVALIGGSFASSEKALLGYLIGASLNLWMLMKWFKLLREIDSSIQNFLSKYPDEAS